MDRIRKHGIWTLHYLTEHNLFNVIMKFDTMPLKLQASDFLVNSILHLVEETIASLLYRTAD